MFSTRGQQTDLANHLLFIVDKFVIGLVNLFICLPMVLLLTQGMAEWKGQGYIYR